MNFGLNEDLLYFISKFIQYTNNFFIISFLYKNIFYIRLIKLSFLQFLMKKLKINSSATNGQMIKRNQRRRGGAYGKLGKGAEPREKVERMAINHQRRNRDTVVRRIHGIT